MKKDFFRKEDCAWPSLLVTITEGGFVAVKHDDITVVIGAGPYGLSTAAYLKAQGVPTFVFGKPMEFWQKMPTRMYLKSVWSASTLFDPDKKYSLNSFFQATHTPVQEPIPLPLFLKYGQWFQKNAVPDVDTTYIQSLKRDGSRFLLEVSDGRTVQAGKVVVAIGVSRFTYVPDFTHHLPSTLASHTQVHTDFENFRGKNVVVLGRGQSALESAALLHESGAQVELIARGPIIWINRVLYDRTGPVKHVFYPASDVGPPGLNWLITFPLIFRHLSEEIKDKIDRRAVRPAGAQWLRNRVEGCIRITPNTQIMEATEQGERVSLKLSDGTTREVDHLFLGTGYRPHIDRLEFIDSNLRQQIRSSDGYPVLNKWFESSIPHLHFIGAIARNDFGPICRFVTGAKVPAQQIARHATRAA
jgi:thioredoxin reductase